MASARTSENEKVVGRVVSFPVAEGEDPWTEEEIEARVQRVLALGRKPAEPFDLKAERDALWSFVEE